MAGITLEQAEQDLAEARAAVSRVLQAQSTQVSTSTGGRRIDLALLASLQARETQCEQRVARLSRRGGLTSVSVVPV